MQNNVSVKRVAVLLSICTGTFCSDETSPTRYTESQSFLTSRNLSQFPKSKYQRAWSLKQQWERSTPPHHPALSARGEQKRLKFSTTLDRIIWTVAPYKRMHLSPPHRKWWLQDYILKLMWLWRVRTPHSRSCTRSPWMALWCSEHPSNQKDDKWGCI